MGHRRHRATTKSHTLPSSPTHSFSSSASSEFEFAVALSPRKSTAAAAAVDLCPADDLFYKGQLLPLHLSPRLSMVRTLLLSSASTSTSSSCDTTTTTSRDSTASTDSSSADLLHHHLDCDSSCPSSATDDDLKRLTHTTTAAAAQRKPSKYFSLPKLFRKDHGGGAAVKRVSSGAREVILKYLKKVKPMYEKLSQKAPPQQRTSPSPKSSRISTNTFVKEYNSQELKYKNEEMTTTHSFSGNLRLYNSGRSCFSSCPSSMGSSPSRCRSGFGKTDRPRSAIHDSDSSSMEELQNAIQGAIMHCKNSMLQTKNLVITSNIEF